MRQPSLFLSHGSPSFLLNENSTSNFWKKLPWLLPRQPRAILCVSAHWDAAQLRISGTKGRVGIQHDYYGFPQALYDISWEEHEDAAASAWLLSRLRELEVHVVEDSRPKDHGFWMPLKTAWPVPAFPVYQLSLCLAQGLDAHWETGKRLHSLRDDGVLIVGSGAITHNLGELDRQACEGEYADWAAAFVGEVEQAIAANDRKALLQPWQFAFGQACHPTVEHYVPLLFALGAANGEQMKVLHRSWMYGTLASNIYAAGL